MLVLVYDAGRLTGMLTADGDWDDAGLPSDAVSRSCSAPTVVIRSDPRAYLEDPDSPTSMQRSRPVS